ncbi:MAG TPA: PA2779 family protein [Ramlibacter sp.]|uniref:PA2779 family protein n=1 Tax=Ramlibacter sp. TaxID=1917967 RepID=UPI002D7E9D69|nr:PA2779 family protein [Ramlibacter sp.]HET8747754.1 PA2779 family protein [Ramlibacter sp.]
MSHLAEDNHMRMARHFPSRTIAVLLAAALAAPYPAAWGGMIDNEALAAHGSEAASTQPETDRAKVQAFLERADIRERLQAMGVSGLNASGRVDAMTDAEVHALAERIDAMPAGGALSDRDLLIIIVIAVIIAILI